MSRLLTWPFLLSLCAGLGSLYLVRFLWRVRDRPGAWWFLVTLVAQAVLCFAYAGALVVADPQIRLALEMVTVVALHWIGVPFLGFALEYTGRSDLVDSWYYRVFFVFPLAATLLVPTNPLHHLIWTGFEPTTVLGVVGASYTNQPVLFITISGGTLGAATGSLLLFDTFLSYGPLYRSEAVAVGLSPLPPAVGVVAWLFQFGPASAINFTAVLFLPHVLLDAYAFAWSDMFEFHPATKRAAERSALDDLGSPVVVLDEQGRVVDFNDRGRALLDVDPVTELLETALGVGVDIDGESQRLSLRQNGQAREYRVTPAELTDSGDNHVGYTLVFQDVTEEVRREQRLQVLNRVLRHNLRNDLSVVKGNVATVRERVDGSRVDRLLELAESKATDLAETGEKARVVAETIRDVEGETVDTDVRKLCTDIARNYEGSQPGTVTVEAEGPVTVQTNPTLLGAVIENLVENALDHSGPEPTVVVSVAQTGDGVRVTVSDDGPGIPEGELRPVRSGEETPLEHGSGFGLWVIRWGTEMLGGEVDFEASDAGTTVTVTIPDAAE